MSNKKYTNEERKSICESWRQSGLNKTAYCRQQGNISEFSLRSWLKQSDVSAETKSAPMKFLQINQQSQVRNLMEASLPNGIILKFDLSLGEVLKELLQWK